jgi:hypothetical protein
VAAAVEGVINKHRRIEYGGRISRGQLISENESEENG